ncbi:MAG: hypothetical protein J5822_07670 [Eubacteriaceae bacterium]|nr:hypothetical protein [Eubacteriaceae bacterium]
MPHRITSEERNILLENPGLVMFDPYSSFRTHRGSLFRALVLPALTAAALFVWARLSPGFVNAHPKAFAWIGCAALTVSAGAVPGLYILSDNRSFRRAKSEHYAAQLRMLLPEELECTVARVLWVIEEKAEGGWILEGKEDMFGYCPYVNRFGIAPDTDLTVIRGCDGFRAFVRRAPETECFYRRS